MNMSTGWLCFLVSLQEGDGWPQAWPQAHLRPTLHDLLVIL